MSMRWWEHSCASRAARDRRCARGCCLARKPSGSPVPASFLTLVVTASTRSRSWRPDAEGQFTLGRSDAEGWQAGIAMFAALGLRQLIQVYFWDPQLLDPLSRLARDALWTGSLQDASWADALPLTVAFGLRSSRALNRRANCVLGHPRATPRV
jgi:hypothetical protein